MSTADALIRLTDNATSQVLRDIASWKTRLPTREWSANDISQVLQVRYPRYPRIETLGAKMIENMYQCMGKGARRADILGWALQLDKNEVAKRRHDIERDLRAARGLEDIRTSNAVPLATIHNFG